NIAQRIVTSRDVAIAAPNWWRSSSDREMAHRTIKVFHCPSANQTERLSRSTTVMIHTTPLAGMPPRGPSGIGFLGYGAAYETPSDPLQPVSSTVARSNYLGVAGALGKDAVTSSEEDGTGANLALYEGVFTNRSRTRIDDIRDGTSNTLRFG